MEQLVRFSVSMEDDLLHQFDHLIEQKGYTNRSEAVRDIVRDTLVEESVKTPDGIVYGALVFLYDHHKRELENHSPIFNMIIMRTSYRHLMSTSITIIAWR